MTRSPISIIRPFASPLFRRLFAGATVALVALFALMYWVSVPFIQQSAEDSEERAARTVLDNVHGMLAQIDRDLAHHRHALLSARQQELRHIIAVAGSRAKRLEEEVRAGRLGMEQARRRLLDELRDIRFGQNDYVWASDYRSVLVSHPDPRLNNADFSQKRDTRGNLIVPPMVEGARTSGEGFHSYWWRRLGEEVQIEKLSFYKHLPTFKLIIGTGVYIDDIEVMLEKKRAAAIEELRQRLKTLRIARTGYLYVFDGKMHMHIHPNANIEHTNFSSLLEPIRKQPIGPMLMALADRPEGLRYKWDRPDDPDHYVHDKISWVRYFKAFDWYVASSVYVNELKESASALRNRLLAAFALAMLFLLALAYVFAKQIAYLDRANRELKEIDRLKTDFLSTVSHELRTPMTSIVGFSQLVRKKLDEFIFPRVAPDDKALRIIAQTRENLDVIVSESQRLTLLINDVLDSAKLEADKVEWRFAPLAPVQLIERALAVTATLAEQKGLKLTCQAAGDLPDVQGDEQRLQQVLINLISNAIKFTPQGEVTLDAARQGRFVCFSVQDTGIGIPADHLDKVFEKFRQVSDTLTNKPQGTGLGLSICEQIITRHGGRIWVESEQGKGSVFRFTLPINRD